jgi:hypothetical protein
MRSYETGRGRKDVRRYILRRRWFSTPVENHGGRGRRKYLGQSTSGGRGQSWNTVNDCRAQGREFGPERRDLGVVVVDGRP